MDRIADRLEIQDVVNAYAEGVDGRDASGVAALFDEDCVFRAFRGVKGEAHGRAAARVLLARLLDTFEATSHHVSNTRIEFDGPDRASAVTALHAWHRFAADRPVGLLWGRYHDEFVRRDDRWLFAVRELRVSGEQDFAFGWLPPLFS